MEINHNKKSVAEWKKLVAEFQQPNLKRAVWQIVNTLGSVLLIWIALYFTMNISWWLTLGLSILCGLFLVRVFIIFHDCGHGSFFKSKKANDILGFITGMLTFTPYHHWKWEHAMHHATNGDLDRRGIGDIWTLTVRRVPHFIPDDPFQLSSSPKSIYSFCIRTTFSFYGFGKVSI